MGLPSCCSSTPPAPGATTLTASPRSCSMPLGVDSSATRSPRPGAEESSRSVHDVTFSASSVPSVDFSCEGHSTGGKQGQVGKSQTRRGTTSDTL